jgi:hypothetical protein
MIPKFQGVYLKFNNHLICRISSIFLCKCIVLSNLSLPRDVLPLCMNLSWMDYERSKERKLPWISRSEKCILCSGHFTQIRVSLLQRFHKSGPQLAHNQSDVMAVRAICPSLQLGPVDGLHQVDALLHHVHHFHLVPCGAFARSLLHESIWWVSSLSVLMQDLGKLGHARTEQSHCCSLKRPLRCSDFCFFKDVSSATWLFNILQKSHL